MKRRILVLFSALAMAGVGSVALALNKVDYRQQGDCFLCSGKSILSLYKEVNGIGVLNFNDFTVCTLRICNEEANMSGSSITVNTSGELGSVVSIDSNIDRRIADVEISLRKGSKPDRREMAEFLCIDCCKQIEKDNQYDVGFIDYQTGEIRPMQMRRCDRIGAEYCGGIRIEIWLREQAVRNFKTACRR